MTPEAALLRVIHYLDRAHETGFKAKAFIRALDVVRNTPPDELERRAAADTLTELDGIGTSSAAVIAGNTAVPNVGGLLQVPFVWLKAKTSGDEGNYRVDRKVILWRRGS